MKLAKNQNVFLSFALTGLDPVVVEARMKRLVLLLEAAGIIPYCIMFDADVDDAFTHGQSIVAAFKHVKTADVFIAIKASEHRSEGQLMELGAAKVLGIPIVVLLHTSAKDTTYMDDPYLCDDAILWESEDELIQKVKALVE